MKTIGIIGAGQMGGGIAHVCALAGFDVLVYDVASERIEAGLATISGNLSRQVNSEKITSENKEAALKRLSPANEISDLGIADFVIEAATEKENVKQEIYKAVCPILKPEAILATNTSSISITRLASVTDRPERFLGVHFMNPVPVMQLVELVRGIATDEATFKTAKELCDKLGKETSVSEDFPALLMA